MVRKLLVAAAISFAAFASAASAKPVLPAAVQVAPLPPGAFARRATLVRTVFGLKEGQFWGTWGFAKKCDAVVREKLQWDASNSEVGSERFGAVVEEEFAAAGFGKPDGRNLFAEDDAGDALQLGLRIDDMDAQFCSLSEDGTAEKRKFRGSLLMTAEWQVYDPVKRDVVARIQTSAGGMQAELTSDGFMGVILSALRESTRALLADEKFRQIAISTTPSPSIARTDSSLRNLVGSASAPARPIGEAPGSVVAIFTGAGMGSGFLVSSDGYLITNEHVVGRASAVRIRWSDGFETQGEVIRTDKRRDVALVKTEPHGRTPLALRRDAPVVGEKVFAVGTPLKESLQNTVTQGVVSANRIIDGFAFIQSDVAVDHGNSGGPLLDEKGRVIGITEMTLVDDGTQRGLNAFIPIGDALDFLRVKPVP